LALENPPDVDASLAVRFGYAGPIAHQTAGHDALALAITRRQRIPSRERDDPLAIGVEKPAGTDEQRTGAVSNQGCKGGLDVVLGGDIGIACCARAASGQDAAAPLASVMNSRRRIIRSPHLRGRATSAALRCRAP